MPNPARSSLPTAATVSGCHHRRRWVPVRRLGRRHLRRIADHLLALDAEGRASRFGVATTDDRIGQYLDRIDFDRDAVFGVFDRRLRLVAMAHLAQGAGGAADAAEFGVSVLTPQRRQGLGSKLFDHAVVHARNRGGRELVAHLARENAGMLAIVRHAGADLRFEGADVVARLPLAADTLGSRVGECFRRRAAAWDYRIKLQSLRA